MVTKKKDLPAKNGKIRKFKFQVNTRRLPKKPRGIRLAEDSLLTKIKILPDLKLMHRGSLVYDELYINDVYDDLLCLLDMYYDYDDMYDVEGFNNIYWSSDSMSLGYIYDVCSLNGSPDYNLKHMNDSFSKSRDTLFGMFKEYMLERGTKRISDVKYKSTCEWLVVYLNKMVKHRLLAIKYTRDNNFKSNHNVVNKNFSVPICKNLIDMLIEFNLILDFRGNKLFGTNNSSMIIPSPELLHLLQIAGDFSETKISVDKPLVKILNQDKEEVPVESVNESIWSIVDVGNKVLQLHRDCLNSVKLDVNGYDIPDYQLQRVMSDVEGVNGRFFDNGTVQGKSKSVRKYIKIDGEDTVSLDFKAIHPSMLLHMEGYSLKTHNPYPTLRDIKVDVKLVNRFKKYYDLESYDPVRNMVKRLFLCLINADNVNAAVGSCYSDLKKDNLKKGTCKEDTMKYVGLPDVNLHEIAGSIIQHNHMIAKYLGVGVGNKLQYKDSCIILYCLDKLSRDKIPCLPIHDALICKRSDKEIVMSVMKEAFLHVVGKDSEANCIIEEE